MLTKKGAVDPDLTLLTKEGRHRGPDLRLKKEDRCDCYRNLTLVKEGKHNGSLLPQVHTITTMSELG